MKETDIRDYLNLMFDDALERKAGHLVIWSPQDKRSASHVAIEPAVASVIERADKKFDVYCGLGLMGSTKSGGQRGRAEDVSCITSFWCDLDVAGPAHQKKKLPSTMGDAMGLLDELQYEPSLIIVSGHGLQAYWCFSEPWTFGTADDRDRAATSARQWVLMLQGAAGQHGWTLDSVGDLSRVFRVPGTVNWKVPDQPVDVTIYNKVGPVYHVEDLIEAAAAAAISPAPLLPEAVVPIDVSNGRILLSAHAEPPSAKLEALRQNDRRFAETWAGTRTLPSASEYDMALANHTVACDWSDQEIVNLLIAGRRMRKDDLKLRLDYYARTIAKARAAHTAARGEDRAFDQLEDLIEQPSPEAAAAAQTPQDAPHGARQGGAATEADLPDKATTPPAAPIAGPEKVKMLTIVSKLLGFKIIRWIQRGREPRRAEYSLVLPDGREVLIGRSASVLRAAAFREAILDAVGVVMPGFKPAKWNTLCRALMAMKEVEENQELDRDHQIKEWLRMYIRDISYFNDSNWQDALPTLDPFIRDGDLYVSVQNLHQFLYRTLGERMDKAGLYGYLGTIGFRRRQVTGPAGGGGGGDGGDSARPSRSYWMAPLDRIQGG